MVSFSKATEATLSQIMVSLGEINLSG
jgi:hypothetical protein